MLHLLIMDERQCIVSQLWMQVNVSPLASYTKEVNSIS